MPLLRIRLTEGALRGLLYMQKYRFLTIPQFGKLAGVTTDHAGEVLRNLEARNVVGFFGYSAIPGQGKTPKVYYITLKGWSFLLAETDLDPDEIGKFVFVSQELSWTPQMYHRLRLLDLFIALECQVFPRQQLSIVKTFIEYRRISKTYQRETADYVANEFVSENRIVPDGVFIMQNHETGNRGLFFVEMDMGTERITAPKSRDQRSTIKGKLVQYDRYLMSGRFASTYTDYGEFRFFLLLFVTMSEERISNIRHACASLPPQFHSYYRFATFSNAMMDFLGSVWLTRDSADTMRHALIQERN
jgi:hypothetical protein